MTKNYSGEFPNQGGLGNLHMQKALYRRQPYSALLHLLPGAQWSMLKHFIWKIAIFRHPKWNRYGKVSMIIFNQFDQGIFSCIFEKKWLVISSYFMVFIHKIGPLNFRMEFSFLDHCVYPGHCKSLR